VIANSELFVLTGIGHVPMEEAQAFAERVDLFIDKNKQISLR